MSLPISFLAGLATFFSPCILPVIPGYISVLTSGKKNVWRRVIFFVVGLILVFTLLGVAISLLGGAIAPFRDGLIRILGLIIFIYGIQLVKPLPFSFLKRDFLPQVSQEDRGDLGALLLGGAFGVAWTPCSGVILGAIFAKALLSPGPEIVPLFLSFALGVSLPMLMLAFVYIRTGRYLKLPEGVRRWYSPVLGGLMIVLGAALLFGWFDLWRAALLQLVPSLESGLLPLSR